MESESASKSNIKQEPQLQCTGITIPIEIWNLPRRDFSWIEKCLLAEIHALGGFKGNCFASNDFLAKVMGMTSGSVAVSLSKFRHAKLISDVGTTFSRKLQTHFGTPHPLAVAKQSLVTANEPLAVTKPHIVVKKETKTASTEFVSFADKWTAAYKEDFGGRKFVLTKLSESAFQYDALRRAGLEDVEILAVARLAWKRIKVKFSRCGKSSDIEHFCKEFMAIRDEVEGEQQTERKPIAHTYGNF